MGDLLFDAYIREIKRYIEDEKTYTSVEKNENGVLDYLNSLNDNDIADIANELVFDEWLNEQLNNTIAEYLYKNFNGMRFIIEEFKEDAIIRDN